MCPPPPLSPQTHTGTPELLDAEICVLPSNRSLRKCLGAIPPMTQRKYSIVRNVETVSFNVIIDERLDIKGKSGIYYWQHVDIIILGVRVSQVCWIDVRDARQNARVLPLESTVW